MIDVDLHLHTNYSHGKAGVVEMYRAARARGLEIFGFSEHSPRPAGYDYPHDYRDRLAAGYPDYIAEVLALQGKVNDDFGMPVLLGLEMDWIEGQEAFMASTIARYPYEYVIAGVHFLGTWGFDASPDDWADLDEARRAGCYERYYQTMAAMAATGMFQIVAHPDLIKIFSIHSFTDWLASAKGQQATRAALKAVKEAGMALEVSSAGLRKPCAQIYPAPPIMRLAAELSIPITFGSDAHCAQTPAFAFDELAAYARTFGYSESVWFRRGERNSRPF